MTVEPPRIDSDEEYAARLGDGSFWEPYARLAFLRAGMPQPQRLSVAEPLGTYPTLISDNGFVVKLFGDRWWGWDSHAAEREAYRVLESQDLPVPHLVAAGELFSGSDGWVWPYLITTQVSGVRLSEQLGDLTRAQLEQIAIDIGRFLRRLHDLPLTGHDHLAPKWDRFAALLEGRRRAAPADHQRWGNLPAHLADQLEDWLPEPSSLCDTASLPRFVHGDLHMDHFFIDPGTKRLVSVIDFTDVYAGDPRYDLPALHFGSFRADKNLLKVCLQAYGWPTPGPAWPRELLALSLLRGFNTFRRVTGLERFATLDQLADAIWNLDRPGLATTG